MKKSKILSALLAIVMMLSCLVIPAMASNEAQDTGVAAAAAGEVKNADGSITIKEGFTIPADLAGAYGDTKAYPFAIFTKGEEDTEAQFVIGVYGFSQEGNKNSVYGYIGASGSVTANKDVTVIMRRDYAFSEEATLSEDTPYANTATVCNFKSLTFDLNGNTLNTPADYKAAIIYYNIKGTCSANQREYGLNITFKNGTVKSAGGGRFTVITAKKNSDVFVGKEANFTFENLDIVATTNLIVTATFNTLKNVYLPDGFDGEVYNINYLFKNCRVIDKDGATPNGENMIPFISDPSLTHEKIKININCEHSDSDNNYLCDCCGEIFGDFVIPTSAFVSGGDGFSLDILTNLPAAAKSVEITTAAGTQTIVIDETLKPDEDGKYRFNVKLSSTAEEVTFKVLNESGAPLKMRFADELADTYTTNLFDSVINEINKGDAENGAIIEALTKDIQDKTAALEESLAGKMDALEVSNSIRDLRTQLEGLYKAADDVLRGQLDGVSKEIADLKSALKTAEATINEAIGQIRKDLEDKTAELAAAVATKAEQSEMLTKYNELKSAYEAADVLFTANDEALAAADATMAAAINELKKTIDDHGARLDSIETMNTIQLVAIIVVALAAVAALVLPIVKGKKKTD